MRRYACRFCIALGGLRAVDVPTLPETSEAVLEHVKSVHNYPPLSAREILGEGGMRGLAASLIEELGPVILVSLETDTLKGSQWTSNGGERCES